MPEKQRRKTENEIPPAQKKERIHTYTYPSSTLHILHGSPQSLAHVGRLRDLHRVFRFVQISFKKELSGKERRGQLKKTVEKERKKISTSTENEQKHGERRS